MAWTGDAAAMPRSVPALHAAAQGLALRAADALEALAVLLDRYHNSDTAKLLREAAAAQRQQAAQETPTAADADAVAGDEAGADLGPDIDPFLATPVDAINLVLDQAQAAFALFRDAAAMAPDAAVREAAEHLAKDALDRVVHLRLDRRRASRALQAAPSPLDIHLARAVAGMADLTALADGVTAAVADLADAAALDARGGGLPDTAALLQGFAALWRRAVRVGATAAGPEAPLPGVAAAGAAAEALRHIRPVLRAAERATDHYAALAAAPPDEPTMWAAQALARQAAHCAGQLRHAVLVTG